MTKRSCGFTLIELLIVISIIGVLMTIGIITYSKFLKDGRDTRRQADLKQIQSSLERYRADHGDYPTALTYLSGLLPTDPVSGDTYTYTPSCNPNCYRYTLCATLEGLDQSACNLEVSSPD